MTTTETGAARIHFFPKGGRWLASSRYRVFLLAEELARLGRPVEIHDPPRILRRYLRSQLERQPTARELAATRIREAMGSARALAGARAGEILFAQRSVYSGSFAMMLLSASRGKKLVFDLDDAVYEGQSKLTARLVRSADLVVAGSHEIERFSRETGARMVYLFPTSVPLASYPMKSVAAAASDSMPVVGWMGTGPEHYENIKLLKAPLEALAREMDFLFLFVGTLDDPDLLELLRSFNGVRIELISRLDWTNPSEVIAALHRFDVGLMPLTDTPRHRAKCAFKAIESMACGIPVVVSRVGENSHLVQDGVEGFLAGSTEEWVSALRTLLADASRRAAMGAHARVRIESTYDIERNAKSFNAFVAANLG